ncbi:MAG: hypothetical protein K0R39_3417 [Symbiobacteriaceae bacterium]|nr:hypothetical protein [Symbiobacteriaceae bacterium]
MAVTLHPENFVVLRKLYPRISAKPVNTRLEVAPPATSEERDYRDLLTEANENFFNREYTVALQNYLALRQKILVQSHPEMPKAPGSGFLLDLPVTAVDWSRLVELSRRYFELTDPGAPVMINLKEQPLINPGQFPVNEKIARFSSVGMDPQITSQKGLNQARESARAQMRKENFAAADELYVQARAEAFAHGDYALAAELTAEQGAMKATYAAGELRREALREAATSFEQAAHLYGSVGNSQAQSAMQSNLANIYKELEGQATVNRMQAFESENAATLEKSLLRKVPPTAAKMAEPLLPMPQTALTYVVPQKAQFLPAVAVVAEDTQPKTERQVGLLANGGVQHLSISPDVYEKSLQQQLYEPRVTAVDLDQLRFFEEISTNFVAYIPHLFFFVLPIAIGDTYLALGRYQKALEEYQSVLPYPFLNQGIEVPYLWLRMARVNLRWGEELFRRDRPAEAKQKYQQILGIDAGLKPVLPATSPLYQPAAFTPMKATVGELIKKLSGQPYAPVNPQVAEVAISAFTNLKKIALGLNFLGLGADHYPVFRFKYMQSVANYLADNAVQASRTFVNFRVSAEAQKMERLQMESAVDVAKASVAVEEKRLEDAALEVEAAQKSREYAELRKSHADGAYTDWTTLGWELATVNAALSWASNAASDQEIRYSGVQYNGKSHDFETDVEDFYDTVGEWKENLNYEIQRRRLERQAAEAVLEVEVAKLREEQAQVRYEVQQLSIEVAKVRLAGAEEMLEYASEKMFDEDLWFAMAASMQDIAAHYLGMAIYAAFLMERAYDLEFDRNLKRIRLDYGLGMLGDLTGADQLKQDIAAFTLDYLQHATKKNPVRLAISLRDEFPAAFQSFVQEGILPFRTDLELFDRRFPGTARRKLKKVEVFVEGLVPLDGVHGVLLHQGISTEWKQGAGGWAKQNRVLPAERMVLSSYQYRRDFTVFQPSDEMLDLFENLGPQGNWTLELPRSANNLDYQAITDIKAVFYFDADYSPELAAHVKAFYGAEDGRSLLLSARFHFPDQYFTLTADREAAFTLHPARFAYNHTNLRMNGIGVRLIGTDGAALAGQPVVVTRASDAMSISGVTDAEGKLLSDQATMAPFAAWKDATPADTFTVALGAGVDAEMVGDIQLFVDYLFTYRPDGTLPA